jgi:hypothetical protein
MFKKLGLDLRRRLRTWLAVETENNFLVGTHSLTGDRDRYDYDREQILEEALLAWRQNPLARRIVELTTQYVVGGGLRWQVDHRGTHDFLDQFWNHPLNQLVQRCGEWCDELTRSGELFLLVTTDGAGMSYVRAVPASNITEIVTAPNDVQQEIEFVETLPDQSETRSWPGGGMRAERSESGWSPCMLHYAINRPVGAVRGESDLAPLLRWLSRYAGWLEDRARLNRYRNSFLFVVQSKFASETERLARQTALAASPPPPGSILVVDESEVWNVINPQLESADANEDGLALKKMIASGSGLPLHFLAEPEGSNRTTAESAGGPTYRRFEQRQEFFTWLVGDLLRVVVARRAMVDSRVKVDAKITVQGADLSARDNAALAVAASTVSSAFTELRDRGMIDDKEYLRLVYRFLGEVVDLDQVLANGAKAGTVKDLNPHNNKEDQGGGGGNAPAAKRPADIKINADGEGRGKAEI